MQPIKENEWFSASYFERRWWSIMAAAENRPWFIGRVVMLSGSLDIETLSKSLDNLLDLHSVLRSRYRVHGKDLLKRIDPESRWPLFVTHIDKAGGLDLSQYLLNIAKERGPRDIENGPLVFGAVCEIRTNEFALMLLVDHIVFDYGSHHLLWADLAQCYDTLKTGVGDIPIQPEFSFDEYAEKENLRLIKDGKAQEERWKKRLGESRAASEYLRADLDHKGVYEIRKNKLLQSMPTGSCPLNIEHDLSKKITTFHQPVISFIAMLSAFVAMLRSITRHNDFTIMNSRNCRKDDGSSKTIGYLSNLLVLRFQVHDMMTFSELRKHVSQQVADAFTDDSFPIIPMIFAEPGKFFLVDFNLRTEAPVPVFKTLSSKILPVNFASLWGYPFDIYFVINLGATISGTIMYNRNLFSTETATSWSSLYCKCLHAAVFAPSAKLGDVS